MELLVIWRFFSGDLQSGFLCSTLFESFTWCFSDDPAREVLKDACQDLMLMCQQIKGTFDKTVNDFRTKNPPDNHPSEDMDSD